MIKIGDREVELGLKPYIVAEAAIQFHGRPATAKAIARRAKRAGADAIKFQMFLPDEPLFCPLEGDENRWPRWERSFMSFAQWRTVKEGCDDIGIDFLASAFQHKAVEYLKRLNVKAYKVASRAVEAFPYEMVPGPFIASSGMGELLEVFRLRENGIPNLLLQCKSEYPHKPYAWHHAHEGLSDHSGSPWPAIWAMARGCALVEVHVVFMSSKDDPDRSSSITLPQLRMICDARDNFAALRQD